MVCAVKMGDFMTDELLLMAASVMGEFGLLRCYIEGESGGKNWRLKLAP